MYTSIICLISRIGSEELIINNLKRNICGEFEIVFVIDNLKFPTLKLQIELERLKPRNLTILRTKNPPPPVFTMVTRRNRIAHNHNLIKENLGSSSFVFGFEDDTELPDNALANLIEDYKSLDSVGYIEGVQVGRWGKKYIGAWDVDDIDNPAEFKSAKPAHGLGPIDAGGFYCFLTPTSLYKEHEFKWNEPLGPDVEYSLSLRKQGYQNYIDFSIPTKHITAQEVIEVSSDIPQKTLTKKGNRWI